MAVKKGDKSVKELAAKFADHNDVLNRLWVLGYPVQRLKNGLAKTANGTNDTTDIIARLVNDGMSLETISQSLDQQIAPNQYDWPFTMPEKPGTVQVPRHTSPSTDKLMPPMNDRLIGARGQGGGPAKPQPNPLLGQDRGGGGTGGGGGGGGAGGVRTIVVQAPPPPAAEKKNPKSPAEVEKHIREKYGSYSWMLDDPAFGEVRGVLEQAARDGLDEQGTVARLQNTAWWKALDEDQRKWDIDEKTGGTTIANKIGANKEYLGQLASQMGLSLDDGRLTELARMMGRNNWNEFEIRGALAGEAAYKPDYGGQIGEWETKAKGFARDYLQPISDEAAFEWAKKAVGGLIDEGGIQEHFIKQAVGLIPQYQKELESGVTARQILNPQIQTIANLLELGEDQIDLIGDTRFSSVVSNPEKRVLSVAETAKVVKQTDDYWKTHNASKEVSGIMNGLAQSFGKLA